MHMPGLRGSVAAVGTCAVVARALVAPPVGKSKPMTMPKLIGSASAGASLFTSDCGTCHTLKGTSAAGTIGPNLSVASTLTEATIIKAISDGGATVMTKAQVAKYPTTMTAFKSVLTTTQIDNIAAFVYSKTHMT